jgi:hypothetical protein
MRRLAIAALLFVAFDPAFTHPVTRWTRDKVVGLRFYIVDPVRVESYWCTKDGFVAVEIGTHKAITPPLWHWKIHDGRLQFSDGHAIKEEFTLLEMRDGSLTVRRRSGEIASFRYRFEHQQT